MNKELEDKIMNVIKDYSLAVSLESLVRCICNIHKDSTKGTPITNEIYQLGSMTTNVTNQIHQYFGNLLQTASMMTNPPVDKKDMH